MPGCSQQNIANHTKITISVKKTDVKNETKKGMIIIEISTHNSDRYAQLIQKLNSTKGNYNLDEYMLP